MLSSKELLQKTGISRATLNNYIALGLMEKPQVLNPGTGGTGPRQLGYFQDDAAERIRQIQQLKKEGMTMNDIALRLGIQEKPSAAEKISKVIAPSRDLRLTVDDIPCPAYMVNYNFELVWLNPQARTALQLENVNIAETGGDRFLFRMLADTSGDRFNELMRFNMALAKRRLSPRNFETLCQGIEPQTLIRLRNAYAEVSAAPPHPIVESGVALPDKSGGVATHKVYASFFREGIFVVLTEADSNDDSMLELIARRDEVIHSLMSRRLPVLTDLAVLVADLQGSVNICSELPPEEYFQLINEIWARLGSLFRKYHGTYGKHVGDGMVYYFFPEPDSNYLLNALNCALEIRREMVHISKSWQIRKNWLNELYLNTGITEGQEWLGTFQSTTSVEFVVLGDTINQAARISDLARHGEVWATKSLLTKLPRELLGKVRYGIRRRKTDGHEVFVDSSFAMVSSLADSERMSSTKLSEIATLPITEVVAIDD
jgi:adenylate cyclase